ncbi:MAG TPA: adenylate/guanylate cyclase domain-containing protein [Dongiaceae bacterium]
MAEERAQRRLAAILSADVVGYSRLMEEDEAGTFAALKSRRKSILEPLVARYGGRVFKIIGDGVLVEFASAVNAVQCAIDLQQQMVAANGDVPGDRQIVLRIGVNLGDVMVEGSDLYGDGVNIAARLQAIADPGSILVSSTAHDHVANKIAASLEDLGPQALKNMAQPVRTYRVLGTPRVSIATQRVTPDKPAIAVLPFVNMSGDPEQEFFADGLTEDIITALSRVSGLTVIARTSSFVYKDQKVDTKRIARELGVGYIMEGSVRRAGDRMRVTAQLVDASTGHHVWAERYDRPTGDIFDVQDEIMRNVAATTETQIQLSERLAIELRASGEPRATDLVMRAWGRIYDFTPEALAEAAELTEQAIRLEPTNPRAHIIRTRVHVNRLWFGVIPHNAENLALGLRLAETGIRFAPRDEWAHFCMGFAYGLGGRFDEAVAKCSRAIELNPNFSTGYSELGRCLAALGRAKEAIDACRTALRLNPRDPSNWERHSTLAIAYFTAGEFEASLQEASMAVHVRPELPEGLIVMAAATAALGQIDEARRIVAQCVTQWPDVHLGNIMPIYVPRLVRDADRQRLFTMLRNAGLPE